LPLILARVAIALGACAVAVVSAGPAAQAQAVPDCGQASQISCYGPAQIQQAYGLPELYARGVTGRGTTSAIVDPYGSPTIANDLSVFDAEFGLPAPPSLQVIQPAGQIPGYSASDSSRVAWAIETTLDVEYAHAVAPGANIVLVETPVTQADGVLGLPQIVAAEKYLLKHYHVDVVSQSFTVTEQTLPSQAVVSALRGAYTEAESAHVTVVAGSGDSGATNTGLDGVSYYLHPVTSYPASDPLVTSVGGTRLYLDANGNRTAADSVWNDTYDSATNEFDYGNAGPNPLASGGGQSVLFARPAYQDGVRSVTGNARGVPDVSMSAACSAPVDVYLSDGTQSSGWYPACGTSEAAPLFAGVVALADQVAGHPLGLINPALYELSAEHAPGIVDVTSGSNTVSFGQSGQQHTVTGFSARSGYSLAAGVGTVDAATFVPELAAVAGRQGNTRQAASHQARSHSAQRPATPLILACLPPAWLLITTTPGDMLSCDVLVRFRVLRSSGWVG
jgi:subtilase family serine protease